MSYCTADDLTAEFGEVELIQLTDRNGTGQIDAGVLAKAIGRADRLINGFLGARQLPVPADTVVDIACDLARYYLYKDECPEEVRNRYKDALKRLEMMAASTLAVVDADGDSAALASDAAQMASGGKVFGRNDDGFL